MIDVYSCLLVITLLRRVKIVISENRDHAAEVSENRETSESRDHAAKMSEKLCQTPDENAGVNVNK